MTFNFSYLSKYRRELMGIAALMIMICHASVFGVSLPSCIHKFFSYGNEGVDIFLLLSGMGLSHSLLNVKPSGLQLWYKKRYIRILLPYFIIATPFYVFRMINEDENIWLFILNVSTLSFWLNHIGAWYVAMLLPLYLITPLFFFFIKMCKKHVVAGVIMCLILLVMTNVLYSIVGRNDNSVWSNVCCVMVRLPSFFLGMVIFPLVQSGKKMNAYGIIMGSILLYLLLHFLFPEWICPILRMIPILVVLTFSMKFFSSWFMIVWGFLGTISLESYLMNIFLGYVLKNKHCYCCNRDIFYGSYLSYLLVILVGLFLSYLVNKITSPIIVNKSYMNTSI